MRLRVVPLLLLVLTLCSQPAFAWTPTHRIQTRRGHLYLRPLDGESLLFAYRPAAGAQSEIEDSPLWSPEFAASVSGGTTLEELALGQVVELGSGRSFHAVLDPVRRTLSLELNQKLSNGRVRSTRFDFAEGGKGISRVLRIRAAHADHLFGLGEHLAEAQVGQIRGDLKGTVRHSGQTPESYKDDPKGVYGNMMVSLAGGMVGNALFPSLMMIDDDGSDTLLFLSNPADSVWDFRKSPWTVELRQGELEGALAFGEEAHELRRRFMGWTGKAPVPPRKAFGLWVSEYGYENWEELEEKADGLQESGFPVDGFVLDLQWFGGIKEADPNSRMGSLTFDTENFPSPKAKIAELAGRGLGLVLIEEAYICQGLPEFQDLSQRGFLVRSPEDKTSPHIVDETPWWGLGSMLDYTNPKAGDYWHQTKREPMRELGVLGHWTDLGEPEVFRHKKTSRRGKSVYTTPLYAGDKEQLEVNNLFAFRWAESIFRGYGSGQGSEARPFIVSRTGTSGIWRFGACLWSGDIGSNWESLRSHYRAQANLSVSGLDYYGSDVGGFYRKAFENGPGGFDQLYTRWFGAACLTDVPLRPHTMNLGNKFETAPHLVGDKASNLANLRQRYSLIPYLYSVAHQAWETGSPVVSPPVLWEQDRGELDHASDHKMLGPSLLARLVLEPNLEQVEVLLPSGRWFDFESGRLVADGTTRSVTLPATVAGLMRTPLLAREGSLIPLGSEQSSEPNPSLLRLKVFPGAAPAQFELVEDDGWSQAYRTQGLARTRISQTAWEGNVGQVSIGPREGAYAARLPQSRSVELWVAGSDLRAFLGSTELEVTSTGGFQKVILDEIPSNRDLTINFR